MIFGKLWPKDFARGKVDSPGFDLFPLLLNSIYLWCPMDTAIPASAFSEGFDCPLAALLQLTRSEGDQCLILHS